MTETPHPQMKPEDEQRIEFDSIVWRDTHDYASILRASGLSYKAGATAERLRSYGIEEELALKVRVLEDARKLLREADQQIESLRAERDELKAQGLKVFELYNTKSLYAFNALCDLRRLCESLKTNRPLRGDKDI